MINLQFQGATSQRVVLTLDEKLTCGATGYVFVFRTTNVVTQEVKVFTATDASLVPQYYNEFQLWSVGSTGAENLNIGRVNWETPGTLDYEVYQVPSNAPDIFDIDDADALLEVGRLKLNEQLETDYYPTVTTETPSYR